MGLQLHLVLLFSSLENKIYTKLLTEPERLAPALHESPVLGRVFSARYKSFIAASSFGNAARVLMIFRVKGNGRESMFCSAMTWHQAEANSWSTPRRRLDQLGLANKQWTTKEGKSYGGQPLRRCHIYSLLTNPLYAGRL